MTFYLQEGVPDNPEGWPEDRVFLDDRRHPGCKLHDYVDAVDWKAARAEFPG